MTMLRTKGRTIIDGRGNRVQLKGVNFGGWLLMEAYFLCTPNEPVQSLKKELLKTYGSRGLAEFESAFQGNWIKESDVKNVKAMGMNVIRVPFHYQLVEKRPGSFDPKGIAYLDRVISWGKKYRVWIILDLHAAPGGQNPDWHSDSLGTAEFWNKPVYQKRVCNIWEFLADRYRDETWVAGYDILNEAVLNDVKKLNGFYHQAIKAIRRHDRDHILFIEGDFWAQNLDVLDEFDDDNHALSIHYYIPNEFSFHLIPGLNYPLKQMGYRWDKTQALKYLRRYDDVSRKRNVPILAGEFGVNTRDGKYGEHLWLRDVLSIFNSFGFHWTYWTYKAVKNFTHPDGIYSYYPNPAWVHREGPARGWNTFPALWKKHKREMARSWMTTEFTRNAKIYQEIKNAL